MQAEGLRDFFKTLGKKRLDLSDKWARNVLGNPTRASDITAINATAAAAASRNHKKVLSQLPEPIIFYHTVKGLYLGFIV